MDYVIVTLCADEEEEMDEDDILGQVQQPEGKIGAKKMRKLQEKAERKAAREVGCSKEPGDTLTELSWLFVLCWQVVSHSHSQPLASAAAEFSLPLSCLQ